MSRKKNKKRGNKKSLKGAKPRVAQGNPPVGFSTPVLQHYQLENPLSGLNDAQCRELFGAMGREATKRFQEGFSQLEALVRSHDPLELLATSAFYCLMKGMGPETDFTDDDPYTQAVVEVIQSVCLRFAHAQFGGTPVLHGYMFAILDLAKQCSEDYAKQRFTAYETVKEDEKHLLLAVEGARLHTQVMRNWGYPQHMRKIIRALFEPLEAEIASVVGLGPLLLLDLFEGVRERACNRAFDLMTALGQAFQSLDLATMVHEFCQLAGSSREDEQRILDILRSRPSAPEEQRFFLLSYFHQFISETFTFTVEHCLKGLTQEPEKTKVQAVLDGLSFQLGDLAAENPQHLLMQSKIRTRPLIRIAEGTYFLPVVGLVHSFFVEIVESLIKPHESLKNRYHKRRASFLEEELCRLLSSAFPECPVHRETTGISPVDGKEFENDCLVIVGPLGLVFEAKSERVDDAAKRGGTKTLLNHYGTLVQEPAKQGERFARILETGRGPHSFQTKKHGSYELDLTHIRQAVSVSVTLDWFPAPTLCWQQLLKGKLMKEPGRPAINLSLADLMVVLEVLDRPALLLHYLWRRIEWEGLVDYLADEEDLLVYYLSHGLVIPEEVRGGTPMLLYGNSKQLHRHYLAAWAEPGTTTPPPRRILTDWWSSIIRRIETLSRLDKWDIACVLLDLNYPQQQEFERHFTETSSRVRKKGNSGGTDALIFRGPPSQSRGAVIGFAYRDLSTQERNDRAADLTSAVQREQEVERVVVLGRDVSQCSTPYDFLAFSCSAGE